MFKDEKLWEERLTKNPNELSLHFRTAERSVLRVVMETREGVEHLVSKGRQICARLDVIPTRPKKRMFKHLVCGREVRDHTEIHKTMWEGQSSFWGSFEGLLLIQRT